MRFLHSGDLGDLIYAIPSMRGLCERDGTLGEIFLGDRDWTRSIWTPTLLSVIEPLLRAQDFVEEVRLLGRNEIPPFPFTDFSTFRNGGYQLGDTIYERQRRWVRAPRIDFSKPWLDVSAALNYETRLIINRTARWLGIGFPWREILAKFSRRSGAKDSAVFIGLASEYGAFLADFGRDVIPFRPTANLLEAARVLASSSFFIGNQSSIGSIANGLGMPMLTEACLYAPDCFFPRENAHYCLDGSLDLEILGVPFRTPVYEPVTSEERQESSLFFDRARRALNRVLLQGNSCAVGLTPR